MPKMSEYDAAKLKSLQIELCELIEKPVYDELGRFVIGEDMLDYMSDERKDKLWKTMNEISLFFKSFNDISDGVREIVAGTN